MARILVIDDDDEIRRLIVRVMESAAHEVLEARDGAEGLKCITNQDVDVVITDIFMPGRDGLEILREIRKNHPHMHVIAMSGGGEFGDMDVMRIARSFGAFRVLAKPFRINEMLQTVDAALAELRQE